MKRDLYEKVDGQNGSDSKPEESPLIPGSVKMHREANTSDKDAVVIKNDFNRSDLAKMSSEIDLDFKYSEFALIKKSNGMVSESRVHFSEQLNLGQPIKSEGGLDVNMMKISLKSHVSLIESQYFGQAEFEVANFHLFVKLVVPKSAAGVSVNKTQSQMASNDSMPSEQNDSSDLSGVSLKRSRRSISYNVSFNASSANASLIGEIWQRILPRVCLNVNRTFILFKRIIFGIRVKAVVRVSVDIGPYGIPEIGVKLKLHVGRQTLVVFYKRYTLQLLRGVGVQLQLPQRKVALVSMSYKQMDWATLR